MAQVLLHEPDILIMDEPTSGLDPNQIRDVRELIRELGKTKTILISTHILQEVQAVAGHVILINEGKIVFDGTLEEMAAGESLEEAFYRLTGKEKEEQAAPPDSGPPPDTGDETKPKEEVAVTAGAGAKAQASSDGAAPPAEAEEPAGESTVTPGDPPSNAAASGDPSAAQEEGRGDPGVAETEKSKPGGETAP